MINWFDDPSETPLTEEEFEQLLVDANTRAELNGYESANIESAMRWAEKSRIIKTSLVTSKGLRRLHLEMFQDTWKWAGKYRDSNKNIGVPKEQISEEMEKLCGDMNYWREHNVFSPRETAVRFHHRLVLIHPFANGNGRHARLAADLYVRYQGGGPLLWGAQLDRPIGDVRKVYIAGLREADKGLFEQLISFVG